MSNLNLLVRSVISLNRPSAPPGGQSRALGVPGYRSILISGWFWQMARWGVSFVGAFIANERTGSARLIQLTGVALWAPLFFGGIVGGVVSDRFDRRRTVITQFLALIPLALLLGVLSSLDRLSLWMVYPFMVTIGISWVIDMTSRRALIYDLVGASAIDNAMSLEMLSSSTGLAVGALLGGAVIQAIGIDAAFFLIAGLLVAALFFFFLAPRPAASPVAARPGVRDLLSGLGMLKTEKGLLSVLGVTVAINFFFFSFSPLVQRIADRLDVGPTLIGLLAAMMGLGMMTGATLLITLAPKRRGWAYVIGSFTAFLFALGFVATENYIVTAFFLYLAAVGMGFFGGTQGVLVMAAVDDARRGRALGLLSMAIGVLPIGMILLGELAEVVGAPLGITLYVSTGALLLIGWLRIRPEVLTMESS